jgi:hypothetical protein
MTTPPLRGTTIHTIQMTEDLRPGDIFTGPLQKSRRKNFPGFPVRSAALYHMPCTWNVPAIYLAAAAQVRALIVGAGPTWRIVKASWRYLAVFRLAGETQAGACRVLVPLR